MPPPKLETPRLPRTKAHTSQKAKKTLHKSQTPSLSNVHGDFRLVLHYKDTGEPVEMTFKDGLAFAIAEPGRPFRFIVETISGVDVIEKMDDGSENGVFYYPSVNGTKPRAYYVVGENFVDSIFTKDKSGDEFEHQLVFTPRRERGEDRPGSANSLDDMGKIECDIFRFSGRRWDPSAAAPVFAAETAATVSRSVGKKQLVSAIDPLSSGTPVPRRQSTPGRWVTEHFGRKFAHLIVYYDERRGLEMRQVLPVSRLIDNRVVKRRRIGNGDSSDDDNDSATQRSGLPFVIDLTAGDSDNDE
jgi:hypothetical protein